ncbi:amidase family protein, partial [Akkermansia sp.]|uniref:amidase family protein n=1 Tax=Akkermansia sp. TaxID=1872421 RepID=UPI003A85C50E
MTTGKIAAVRRLLDSGEVSCGELTRRYLDAIGRDNGRLNAYVNVTAEAALAAAEEVDKRRAKGEKPAPLEGVPMTLKDNISTTGIETTCCSRILKGYRPIYDATVWRLLQNQHAVLLGKTNMDEFAMG